MLINIIHIGKAYDFNSGYFMAIKVHDVDPEELRKHLIENIQLVLLHLMQQIFVLRLAV